jgi:hypothetical protein
MEISGSTDPHCVSLVFEKYPFLGYVEEYYEYKLLKFAGQTGKWFFPSKNTSAGYKDESGTAKQYEWN